MEYKKKGGVGRVIKAAAGGTGEKIRRRGNKYEEGRRVSARES